MQIFNNNLQKIYSHIFSDAVELLNCFHKIYCIKHSKYDLTLKYTLKIRETHHATSPNPRPDSVAVVSDTKLTK